MGRKKKSNFYFTEETQNAIIKYNETENIDEKNKIFEKYIYYPFMKISENLIHRYKFYYFDVPYEDVKKEVTCHMWSKLNNFNKDTGKAFSYFSVVAKNYLILANNANYSYIKKRISIDGFTDAEEDFRLGEIFEQANRGIDDEKKTELKYIINAIAEFIENEVDFLFNKERDKKIALAIAYILRRYEHIDTYYKKSLYILIREHSNEETHYITKVLNKISKYKDDIINNYHKDDINMVSIKEN